MPPDTPAPGSPEDWLRHAESDLTLARLGRQPGVFLENLTFHAQQSAEKALKALLLAKGLPLPKTHNIRFLLDQVSVFCTIPAAVQQAASLTDYAVALRYPSDFEPIIEEEYLEALELASGVLAWVGGQLGS